MGKIQKATVLGAGSWGTTLAIVLYENGLDVALWEKFPEQAEVLKSTRQNEKFLPGVLLPDTMTITSDLQEALRDSDMIVLAVPSHILRSLLEDLKLVLKHQAIFVSVIKGIEQESLLRMSEVTKQVLGDVRFVSLSGPTHAEEVSRKQPSTIVAACQEERVAELVQEAFSCSYLRVYRNIDLIGVELGGSLKNVIAIAAGISDGLGYGDNSKSALMTRGLAEMTRLGVALGAQAKTFSGLSGVGDLITTCMSEHSRNRYVGQHIGEGQSLDEVLASMNMVAEGVKTCQSTHDLARKMKVDMPIHEEMHAVLFAGKDPREAVRDLMTRDSKSE